MLVEYIKQFLLKLRRIQSALMKFYFTSKFFLEKYCAEK